MLRSEGFIPPSATSVSHEEVNSYLEPYIEPLNHETFHLSRKWLQRITAKATDFRSEEFLESFKTSRQMNLPPNYLMFFRVLGGLIGIAMPTRASERWIQDGDALKAQFEEAGFIRILYKTSCMSYSFRKL